MKFPIGSSNFAEIIQKKYTWVDKSEFAKEVIDDASKVLVFLRPRRFGKTLNLYMLNSFLSHTEDKKLFNGLKITKNINFCQEHQNQYQTILLTFKDVKELNYKNYENSIKAVISRLYSKHKHLLKIIKEPEDQKKFSKILNEDFDLILLKNSLGDLTRYIFEATGQTPFLLIDKYDTPIYMAYQKSYYEEAIDLMRGLLGGALKDNTNLNKAILTGITRISSESIFSGINNIDIYSTMEDNYSAYFGFNETEVDNLLKNNNLQEKASEIKKWYNGYSMGSQTIYNPWSIINCLKRKGRFEPYWANTSDNSLIKQLITQNSPNIKQNFETLLQDKPIEQTISSELVFSDLKNSKEAIWSLLLYTGYLSLSKSEWQQHRLVGTLNIPNYEVKYIYAKIIDNWFSETLDTNYYEQLITSLTTGNVDKFTQILSLYMEQSSSFFDFNQHSMENTYHIFILGMIIGTRDSYIIKSNQESGLGRYDIILIPKDKQKLGILLEFKASKTADKQEKLAKTALEQNKNYTAEFSQHEITKVLAISIAFHAKTLKYKHETINLTLP